MNSNCNTPDGSSVVTARAISEARNPIFSNSNRSSLDTCSYNTLILHNEDNLYGASADYGGNATKKERPRSFGTEQVIKEILETPDYSVLKQLVKEMKFSSNHQTMDSGEGARAPPKYGCPDRDDTQSSPGHDLDEEQSLSKLKSKSQPDLSRIIDIDLETIEAMMKENLLLKEQLNHCYKKVAKTKKLEEEVSNIYRVHEELVQSCERREKLERAARTRLQSDVQRLQEVNKALKEEVDVYQSQLLSPSEHQMVIAQLFQQSEYCECMSSSRSLVILGFISLSDKELNAAKERQEIELAAQRATLQEQRKHIGILDKALHNAQQNRRCLEEEVCA